MQRLSTVIAAALPINIIQSQEFHVMLIQKPPEILNKWNAADSFIKKKST